MLQDFFWVSIDDLYFVSEPNLKMLRTNNFRYLYLLLKNTSPGSILSKLMTNNLEMLGRTFILDTSEDARIMDDYTDVFLQLLRVGRPNNLKARNKSGAIACKGHKKCAIKILLYNTDRSNDNLNI